MTDDLTDQLVALYRAGAVDEPDARLDGPILKAARRRKSWERLQIALASAVFAAVIVTVGVASLTQPDPVPAFHAIDVPPGWTDGQERIFLLQAGPPRWEQTTAMNIYPAMMTDWPASNEGGAP